MVDTPDPAHRKQLPDLDPVLTLAQTMHSTPSAYAVLLGAGVSIAAGVPSAWGVVEQLVIRLAAQEGDDAGNDPAAWFRARYQREPGYEQLIEALACTQLERQRLLAGFFDPPPGDDGQPTPRQPSPAHRALARLVASGHVRVILTLNFDRLTETALREVGIEPTVVTSPADLAGLAPLHTLPAVVVHLHGDYLTATAMLNTAAELEAYPEQVDQFLDRALTDYGLLIVGWSAAYDPALRNAVARQTARHFTQYWVDPAPLNPLADDLRAARSGVKITATADRALGRLADAVTALDARAARHPLTLPVAIATAKRELAGQPTAIGLHDQLHAEFDRLRRTPDQTRTDFYGLPDGDTDEALYQRVDESLVLPCGLVATTAYWGKADTDRWWLPEITRYAQPARGGGTGALLNSLTVPAAHLLFCAGVAAVAAHRYGLARQLLSDLEVDQHSGREPLARWAATPGAVYAEVEPQTPSHRVYRLHTPTFVEHLGLGQDAYDDAWETFEILRLTETTWQQPGSGGLIKATVDASQTFAEQEAAYTAAEEAGDADQVDAARRRRAEAWRERHRRLGSYADLVLVDRPHLRVAGDWDENSLTYRLHPPVVGRTLLIDVRRTGATHPLLQAGFCGGDLVQLDLTLQAINLAVGRVGKEAAYGSITEGRASGVPDYFWLDTRQRPPR